MHPMKLVSDIGFNYIKMVETEVVVYFDVPVSLDCTDDETLIFFFFSKSH